MRTDDGRIYSMTMTIAAINEHVTHTADIQNVTAAVIVNEVRDVLDRLNGQLDDAARRNAPRFGDRVLYRYPGGTSVYGAPSSRARITYVGKVKGVTYVLWQSEHTVDEIMAVEDNAVFTVLERAAD